MTLTRPEAEESKEMEGLRAHANALLSLSSHAHHPSSSSSSSGSRKAMAAEGVFECKTCRRRFPSFQALGGHRTSHTRLQARMLSDPAAGAAGERDGGGGGGRARVHECAVCGLEFSMGQALGGHMRRHRGEAPPMAASAHPDHEAMPDLNFPPLEDDGGGGSGGQEHQEPPRLPGGDGDHNSRSSEEPQLLNLLV